MCYHDYMTQRSIVPDSAIEAIKASYLSLAPHLNERSTRIWAATEANRYGLGGATAVHRATRIDYKTIRKGKLELESDHKRVASKIRISGGGRKSLSKTNPDLSLLLDKLIESSTRGDPESLLLWTSKSTYKLAEALAEMGHKVSQTTVHRMLMVKGYSLQSNRKKLEGKDHPDRDAQFIHINNIGLAFQAKGCPVLSIDTKKKENIGNFKNNGSS